MGDYPCVICSANATSPDKGRQKILRLRLRMTGKNKTTKAENPPQQTMK